MPIELTNFRVDKLHSFRSFNININDNKLILVGENGSGKTTLINLLYFFLSRQWARMARYRFDTIVLTINGVELKVDGNDLKPSKDTHFLWTRLRRKLPRSRFEKVQEIILNAEPDTIINEEFIRLVSRIAEVPMSILRELFADLPDFPLLLPTNIDQVDNKLREILHYQVLYLPTYRRIEQDLQTIFPDVDLDELPWTNKIRKHQKRADYIELVEFGMGDVDQRIDDRLEELKENVRNGLNKLTGSYLREIISERYKAVNIESVKALEEDTIESIMGKVEEAVLPEEEKIRLREILKTIQSTGRLEDDQRVIAHFLLQLVDLHHKQQSEEKDVRQFISICNKYLKGKNLLFDNNKFTIAIKPTKKEGVIDEDAPSIAMRHLSSGEKQIVSLFSHLFLSKVRGFFVLIDEPELSLSVPWQKDFLIDILGTKYAQALIAVTHSPFIYDNSLDSYAHGIDEFLK